MFALSRAKNNQDELAMPQVDLEVSEMGRTPRSHVSYGREDYCRFESTLHETTQCLRMSIVRAKNGFDVTSKKREVLRR